jgi:hypothetical protein
VKQQRLWLVIPASDTARVCSYLKLERVHLPVVAITDAAFPQREVPSDLIFISYESDIVITAPHGLELLSKVGSVLTELPVSVAPTNPEPSSTEVKP